METYWRDYKKAMIKFCREIGYKGVKSFDDLYDGGTVNVFGDPKASAPMITIYSKDIVNRTEFNVNNTIINSIEVNTKYYSVTKKAQKLINMINEKGYINLGYFFENRIK